MGYVYDFDIGSFLFFSLTIFFYLRHERMRNLQDRIFTAMLISSMVAVVFDFAAAAMEYHAEQHPVWLLSAVNMLFIIGMQACLPMFFLYSVAATGRYNRFTTAQKALAAIPFAATMTLLFISPFTKIGIFYFDKSHIYQHGPTHFMLYVNMGVYVLAGVATLLRERRNINRAKRNVILAFVAVLFAAMVLQVVFPRYLLTASATALALTAVFYALQSPVDQINPFTGAFSRTLLPSLLQDYVDSGRSFTLLMVTLRSFDEFARVYGADAGDMLLRDYAERLLREYPDDVVVYMDTSEFVIVKKGLMSRAEIEERYAQIPEFITVAGITIPLDVRVGAAPYEADAYSTVDLLTPDYVFRQIRASSSKELIFVDEEYKNICQATLRLESSLGELLAGDSLTVTLTKVCRADGGVCVECARLDMPAEAAEYITHGQFLRAVGQRGHAWEYYNRLFGSLAERRGVYGGETRLCVELLPAAFLHEDSPERMSALVAAYGFEPSQIMLSVTEADIASSLPAFIDNIRRLAERGFSLMVDSFAEGYTDMSLLTSLPLDCARLHESLIKGAFQSERASALLKGLLEVLSDVGISAVCAGIHAARDERAALAAGAELLEGEYVARAETVSAARALPT